ncbi:MAG: carbohydrate ABC transporter permease [Fimbriimonadaceae bacterium]|nr:carbohydrate ABC transporter permease [Fimbriimonadaceae bacterium]
MSGELLFVIGTLAGWVGGLAAARALVLALRLLLRPVGLDPARTRTSLGVTALVAAAGLLILAATPMAGPAKPPAWWIPLAWIYTPFQGLLVVGSVVMVVLRLCQAFLGLSEFERAERRKAAAAWGLVAVVGVVWFRSSNAPVVVFRGFVPLTPALAGGMVCLVVATMAIMVSAARFAAGRGWSKAIVSHLALMVGSVVFGLPFAWLVITSFKEDRDMASPNGIVWIPKVQIEVPYQDPDDPLLVTEMDGRRVETSIIERRPDGTLELDVIKPGSLRGTTLERRPDQVKEIPKMIPVVSQVRDGVTIVGRVIKELNDGRRRVEITEPAAMKGQVFEANPGDLEPVRRVGLRTQNYTDALEFLPPETNMGLVYLRNTLLLVVLTVLGTLLSSAIVAYAFSRLRFPGKNFLFMVLLSTMMLPGAVTLLPTFLIFRSLGMIDTLYPIWIPAFFASAFNVFLLRQFFMTIPMELEDAAKIDGCSYLRTFWQVMLPQVKPALAVIAIWTFMGAWNNFMGPLIYVNSPENMPISYALQLFQGDRGGEPGLLMAAATMTMLPVLALFFFAQKYFIEGVTLSGLGGR